MKNKVVVIYQKKTQTFNGFIKKWKMFLSRKHFEPKHVMYHKSFMPKNEGIEKVWYIKTRIETVK